MPFKETFLSKLALLLMPGALAVCDVGAEQPSVLTLDAQATTAVQARSGVLGHNMTSSDWHGTINPKTGKGMAPIMWDEAANAPDPAWEPLTTAFPLRVVRFHSGNSYDWRHVVGPLSERQPIKPSEAWSQPYRANPGLDEFLRWTESLPVRPEVSLIASPFLPVKDLEDMAAYCNAVDGEMAALRAGSGHPAPYAVRYWELGNETDWAKRADLDVLRAETSQEVADKITPAEYVKLCAERIDALRRIDPGIRFQAHAQTAPWPASNPQWRNWHREVLRGLGPELDGIIIHPYYDGYGVPYVLKSVDALIADIKALCPVNRYGRPLTVVVNEHARWVDPSRRDLWPRSWGLQGAISTGDFLLQLMARPEVSVANYWCFAHKGPWRVVEVDQANPDPARRLMPTAIHHLFQILNDALLPDYRLLAPAEGTPQPAGAEKYPYAVTAGLFSDPKGKARAMVAVNRSADQSVMLELRGVPRPDDEQAEQTLVTASALEDSVTIQTPDAVPLVRSQATLSWKDGTLRFELPPKSVVSWRWQ